MRTNTFRLVCLAGLLILACQAFSQSYRQTYPLPAGYSTNGWAINMNLDARMPDAETMRRLKELGVRFIRCDFSWQQVEWEKGVYDFSAYDDVVSGLRAAGIRPIFTLGYGNSNYGDVPPTTWEQRSAFARFAKAAAARYKGAGILWEIWNEPNKAMFWEPRPDPSAYTALVLETGRAIRSVAPDEWIIGCSVAGFDWTFLERCFESGILEVLDGVSVHPYRDRDVPETVELDWAKLRIMVNRYRRGRSVEVISGEWGYSLKWRDVTEQFQADLAMRTMLTNLASGVGVSVWYEWQDSGTDAGNYRHWLGLHDYNYNPRAAYWALRWLTRAIQGQYIMRVDLPRTDDYCLLFATPYGPRLIAWTAGEEHYQYLPASNGSFKASRRDGSTFYGSSSGGYLAAYLTRSPLLIEPTTSNTLLTTLSSWKRLFAAPSFGSVNEVQGILGNLIANSGWKEAPWGTQMRIEDTADPGSPFGSTNMNTVISEVKGLSVSSGTVQQIVNDLPRLADRSEWARTIRLTLYLRDGTKASQSCRALNDNPMWITVLTPQSGKLPVRVENPTGKAFRGTLYAQAGTKIGSYNLSFSDGDRSRMMSIAEIGWLAMASGYKLSIESATSSSREITPVLESKGLRTLRLADPKAGEWRYELGGNTSVSGKASLSVASAPSGSIASGLPSVRLDYSFGTGGKFISVMPPTHVQDQLWFNAAHTGMWVYGDGSNNTMRARFVDSTGQTFQTTIGRIDWTGWRWIEIPLTGVGADYWNGASDGIVHSPVRITVPLLLDSRGDVPTSGTIYVAARNVVCIRQ